MKAEITKDVYRCAPEGHTTLTFSKGDTVDGRAAEMAISDKAARRIDGQHPKKNPNPKKRSTPTPNYTKPFNGPYNEG
jgi:hypothetical protein